MWHNNVDPHRTQSPPGLGPYNHRQSTMSDTLSVSSATNSQQGGYYQPIQQHQHQHQQPPNYHSPTSQAYLYPSSHIHNAPPFQQYSQYQQPQQYSHGLQVMQPPPPNPYIASPPPSLTSILLASSPQQFAHATQHPFLRLAGQGRLSKSTLSAWLSQDRLYAQSYIGFIGSLIARVDLPYMHIADKSASLRWRLVNCLTDALQNIHRELQFFADTATKYGLDLECPPPSRKESGIFTAEHATKQYIDLFRAFWTDPSMSLLEGMVVLWATEKVYHSAWSYARSFMEPQSTSAAKVKPAGPNKTDDRQSHAFSDGLRSELEGSEVNTFPTGTTPAPQPNGPDAAADAISALSIGGDNDSAQAPETQHDISTTSHATDRDGGALRDAFIPNWTSKEFESFVAQIAELTDLLAEREDAVVRKLDVYTAVWRHILDVERRFWPDVDETATPGAVS
jgi:thiaminase